MTPTINTRTATLLLAGVCTAVATIATIDQWPGSAPPLRTATVGLWLAFLITTSTERIRDDIRTLRADIDTYGEQRHSDGVIDGMANTIPTQPPSLHRIR